MTRFKIIVTDKALTDLQELRDAIMFCFRAPLSAKRYIAGLNVKMQWLANSADYFPIVPELSYQYGMEIRRLNYKKMTILYTIEKKNVFVLRIIPQSMVIY